MTFKYLYVDAQGNPTEANQSVDAFAGTASANRLVETNSSGKIDNSLINFAAFDRVFSDRAASSTNITLSSPGTSIGGVTMNAGDAFLAYGQTTASQNGRYVFNGDVVPATRAPDYDSDSEISAGDLIVIQEGTFAERVYILATNNPIVVGTTALTYTSLGTQLIDAGNGLSYSGTTLNVNLLANRGLKFVGDDIAIEATDIAGLGLIDDGTDKLAIDFAVPATSMNVSKAVKASDIFNNGANQGAKIVGFDPSTIAAYTTATNVQQAILDAFSYAQAPGVLYTAGTGGVTKGALVFVSGNDTASTYAALTTAQNAVGLAATGTAAGSPFKVINDSTVLTGVLTGATAGTKIYWNGSALTATIPPAINTYVWEAGTAKNATDLHVNVRYIKRNSAIA